MPSKLKKSPSAKAIQMLPEIPEDLISHCVRSPMPGQLPTLSRKSVAA